MGFHRNASTFLPPLVLLALSPFAGCKQESVEDPPARVTKAQARDHEAAPKGSDAEQVGQVEQVEVDEDVKTPFSVEAAQTLLLDAKTAVDEIERAREALADKKKGAAKKAVRRARTALDRILAERPAADVAVKMWTNERELALPAVTETVTTVPVFASLDRVERRVASPELEARKKARNGSDQGLSPQEKRADLHLVDADLLYSEIDLPVASTHVHLLAAQKLLEEGKTTQADGVLARAQAGLEIIEIVQKAPEYLARQEIWDAETAFASGNTDAARELLEAAAKRLGPVSADDSDPEAKRVAAALIAEIEPLRKVLEAGNDTHGLSMRRLAQTAWAFAQRAAAREVLTKRRGEEQFALADALMFLEKAETEGLYEGADAAGGNLVLTEAMLGEARSKAPAATKPVLEDLENRTKQLVALDLAKERDAAAIKRLHRELKFDLRMLIYDLGLEPRPYEG